MIRFVGSWLFSYKGLHTGPAYADLTSIQADHPTIESTSEFTSVAADLWAWLTWHRSECFPSYVKGASRPRDFAWEYSFQPHTTAGPSTPIAVNGIDEDLAELFRRLPGQERPPLADFAGSWRGGAQSFTNGIWQAYKARFETYYSTHPEPRPIGRLSAKLEAAGKVRVFAIVDNFTQCILRPLHNFLIEGLKAFGSSDATFDQDGSVRRFSAMVAERKLPLYSYDLKSATDLIPRALYQAGFSAIFGDQRTASWLRLLVDRDYSVGDPSRPGTMESFDPLAPATVRYGTGQPIGALSSWASLAWVHHILVASSAKRAGFTVGTFWDYIILGDDIVIANTSVAEQYLILCQEYSIPISLTKSYVSHNGTFNFANQIFMDWGTNVSPASLHEEAGITSFDARLEFTRRIASRWSGTIRSMADILSLVTHPQRYVQTYPELRVTQNMTVGSPAQAAMCLAWYPGQLSLALGLPALTVDPLAASSLAVRGFFTGLSSARAGRSLAPLGWGTFLTQKTVISAYC